MFEGHGADKIAAAVVAAHASSQQLQTQSQDQALHKTETKIKTGIKTGMVLASAQSTTLSQQSLSDANGTAAALPITVPLASSASSHATVMQGTSANPLPPQYKYTSTEQKLLTMHGYVLQLIGVHQLAGLKRFIQESGLRGQGKAVVFHTRFQDKPWYAVL